MAYTRDLSAETSAASVWSHSIDRDKSIETYITLSQAPLPALPVLASLPSSPELRDPLAEEQHSIASKTCVRDPKALLECVTRMLSITFALLFSPNVS